MKEKGVCGSPKTKMLEEFEVPKCKPGVGNLNEGLGAQCSSVVGGDFRWSE